MGDMMRPLRSGAKANAAGSALRLPLPSLKFGPCPRCVRAPCPPASSSRACPPRPHGPPAGVAWLHEIKHDGFRVIARKDGAACMPSILVTRRNPRAIPRLTSPILLLRLPA